MYMLLRSNRLVALSRKEAPQLVLAMVIAESSFHFHSFSLRGRIATRGTQFRSSGCTRQRGSAIETVT